MKKFLIFFLFLFAFTINSNAQFSLDKFLTEKVSKPDRNLEINLEKMLLGAADAKIEKIPVKVVNSKLKDGRIVYKSISNANIVVAEAKKLNDIMKKKLLQLYGKPAKENVIDGVNNVLWKRKDGASVMLTYSGNLFMLAIINN